MKKIVFLCTLLGVLWGQMGCVKSEPYDPALGNGTFAVKLDGTALKFKKYTMPQPTKNIVKFSVEVVHPTKPDLIALLAVEMYNVSGKTQVSPLSTPVKPEELLAPYYYASLVASDGLGHLFKSGKINITSWTTKGIGLEFESLKAGATLTGTLRFDYQ